MSFEVDNFLVKIIDYIEKNNVASQLLHTFARLYLSISIYLSYCDNRDFQTLSLKYYTLFTKISLASHIDKY
jgi:hypothetical protein